MLFWKKATLFYYLLFLFLSANCSNTIDYYFVASVTMTRSLVCLANLLLTEYPVLTQKKHLRRDAILEKGDTILLLIISISIC